MIEQCDEMNDQRGVDSIDDEGSVTSSNIQDLINHVKMSDTHPHLENATHTGRNLIQRLTVINLSI